VDSVSEPSAQIEDRHAQGTCPRCSATTTDLDDRRGLLAVPLCQRCRAVIGSTPIDDVTTWGPWVAVIPTGDTAEYLAYLRAQVRQDGGDR
jgi:hypothetical protein